MQLKIYIYIYIYCCQSDQTSRLSCILHEGQVTNNVNTAFNGYCWILDCSDILICNNIT